MVYCPIKPPFWVLNKKNHIFLTNNYTALKFCMVHIAINTQFDQTYQLISFTYL